MCSGRTRRCASATAAVAAPVTLLGQTLPQDRPSLLLLLPPLLRLPSLLLLLSWPRRLHLHPLRRRHPKQRLPPRRRRPPPRLVLSLLPPAPPPSELRRPRRRRETAGERERRRRAPAPPPSAGRRSASTATQATTAAPDRGFPSPCAQRLLAYDKSFKFSGEGFGRFNFSFSTIVASPRACNSSSAIAVRARVTQRRRAQRGAGRVSILGRLGVPERWGGHRRRGDQRPARQTSTGRHNSRKKTGRRGEIGEQMSKNSAIWLYTALNPLLLPQMEAIRPRARRNRRARRASVRVPWRMSAMPFSSTCCVNPIAWFCG